MNLATLCIDIAAVILFALAFYDSLKASRASTLLSASASIRSTAFFVGVIWCVMLAFHSFSGNMLLEQAAASLLAFMGGLFTALIIARTY